MDVCILRKSCLKFLKLIEEYVRGIQPFFDENIIAIASLSLKIFCSYFLQPKTIGIIPKRVYRCNINQSVVGLMCLDEVGKNIPNFYSKLTVLGEKIGGVYVDGFNPNTRNVYQFHVFFFSWVSCLL